MIDQQDISKLRPTGRYAIEIFEDIRPIREQWDQLGDDDVFLESEYLLSVQLSPPVGTSPLYVTVRNESGELIGKCYFQCKRFVLDESLKIDDSGKCPSFFNAMGHYFKKYVASKVDFFAIVCGNLTLSGNHAYAFNNLGHDRCHEVVHLAVDEIADHLKKVGKEISVVLMKDFQGEERFIEPSTQNDLYYEFKIQPAMILHRRKEWLSTDDYLESMLSKYRVRYRRARKKLGNIQRKNLTLEEVRNNEETMYSLYKEVAKNAGFNLASLNPSYLATLKEQLGEKLQVTGYYLENRLVGFYTLIDNYKELEAHFLGFESSLNHEYQIYLNMLYDMVEKAIENPRFETVNFARTAMEIKSSVGAEAQDLYCYLKHKNSLQNKFLPHFFEYMNPTESWYPRNPFKA